MSTNSGYRNTGDYNTGDYNTGDYNTGNYNSGYRNSGYRNSGYRNSGYCNTGYRNSGNYNSGDRNSGYRNSGNYNSGNCNTGNYNSGNCNTGNCNTGDCNTDTLTVRAFNRDTGLAFFCDKHNEFRNVIHRYSKPLCEWVSESNMSEEEKNNNSTYKTTGGYLKVNESTFNGKDITPEDEKFLRDFPNFDAGIFLECTGIDINNTKKKIIIDGKEIMISKESFEEIRIQFS